jgi:hypothetical protein
MDSEFTAFSDTSHCCGLLSAQRADAAAAVVPEIVWINKLPEPKTCK